MTSKLSWIAFIPLTIAAAFFKLAQTILPDGTVFGMSDMILDYAAIGCTAVIFLFVLAMCIADRRISPYYQLHRNIPAGIFSLLLAVVCAADGANRIYLYISAGSSDVLEMVEAALMLLSAIVFIVLGMTHALANRDSKHFALFNVMPALLCAIRLVRCFISFTTISIRLADVTLLICYVFATLFFFNLSVTVSLTEAKHAVKSCFIFGFPAAAMLLAYSLHALATSFNAADLFSNAVTAELLLMALYTLSFLLEMSLYIKDKDHVIIRTGDEEPDQALSDDEEEDKTAENYVVAGTDEQEPEENDSYYGTAAEYTDYLVNTVEKPAGEEDSDYLSSQSDPTGYITEMEAPADDKTPYIDMDTKTYIDADSSFDYSDRLDEIDKLILELTGERRD